MYLALVGIQKPMGELHFIFQENKPEMFILLGTYGENLVLSHIIFHNLDIVMQMASTKYKIKFSTYTYKLEIKLSVEHA